MSLIILIQTLKSVHCFFWHTLPNKTMTSYLNDPGYKDFCNCVNNEVNGIIVARNILKVMCLKLDHKQIVMHSQT